MTEINEKPAHFPCEVCGKDLIPDGAHRCEQCKRFACRDCLKIHYHIDQRGRFLPTQTLCYYCYHGRQ